MQHPESVSSPEVKAVRPDRLDRVRALFASKWLMPTITLVLFVLAVMAIYQLLREIHPEQLWAELRGVPPVSLLLSLLFMALSFVFMVGYDASALRYIGKRLPWRTVGLASFTGYAFSNTIGMALVSGASVRYRIYVEAGLDGMDVARVAAFCALAFGIGAHVVAAMGLAWQPELVAERLGWTAESLRAAGIAGLLLAAGVLLWLMVRPRTLTLWRWRIDLPGWRLSMAQLGISLVDILFAGACLYVLLPEGSVPFGAFMLVFVVAMVAGVASHVPGGLGVFEAVMLSALHKHVPAEQLTAALVLFRGIYYLLPLVLASTLLAWREISGPALPALAVARQLGNWSARAAPMAMAGLSFLAGLIMLASAATPAMPGRLDFLEAAVPLMVVEVSHVLAGLVGLSLLILARGLQRRLNGAYAMTLALSAVGIVLNLVKGVDYEESIVLGLVALALFASRKEFYRSTRLLDSPFSGGWLAAVVAAAVGMLAVTFFSFKHVEYDPLLWWQFGFDQDLARSLRATLGVGLGVVLLGLTLLLRPPARVPHEPNAATLAHVEAIVRAQDRAMGNLALLGDKSIMLSEEGDAFLMFGKRGSSFIALGDPVGPPAVAEDLAWRFRELVSREGGRVAFYQVRPESLPLYLDMGLMPLKIGEEAVVMLPRFSLEGKQGEDNRLILNRGNRKGFEFEVVPAAGLDDVLEDLRRVSDDWLESRKAREKRFSLGAFDPAYLRHFDVGVLRLEGRIIAFVSILRTDTRGEVALDLMRHVHAAPKETMRFLLLKLVLHFKEAGYQRFSLAMAPLSGLEDHPYAPVWQRIGAMVYNLPPSRVGNYNFQGLRQFKDKFNPVWEPRYLVTEGGLQPAVILTDVAALVAGGVRGVLGK
ncbi:MAG: bifunctional lysylphosphatidylglycerol flippase/synthetase MprF [Pseudomonadota bacterium]